MNGAQVASSASIHFNDIAFFLTIIILLLFMSGALSRNCAFHLPIYLLFGCCKNAKSAFSLLFRVSFVEMKIRVPLILIPNKGLLFSCFLIHDFLVFLAIIEIF